MSLPTDTVCMSVRARLTWIPVLVQLVHVLSLGDPVHVATQVFLHLLLLPQLLEVSSGLGLLPLLAELSAGPNVRIMVSGVGGFLPARGSV